MRRYYKAAAVIISLVILPRSANAQWYKAATDGSLDPFNKNNNYGSYIDTNKIKNLDVTPRYQTNKFELKAKVEEGNWHVAWANDISETDVAQGVVAAGVSIYAANPGPFMAWVENLVDRTVASLKQSGAELPQQVQGEVRTLAAGIIADAIRGKIAKELSRNFGAVGVKAGAIQYSGENLVGDKVVSRTWGLKPYIAVRLTNPQGAFVAPVVVVGGPGANEGLQKFRGSQTGYIFEHIKGGQWAAQQTNGTTVAVFEEVERNKDFVGLKSHNQFPHIRLYADHVDEFIPHTSTNWQRAEAGSWLQ